MKKISIWIKLVTWGDVQSSPVSMSLYPKEVTQLIIDAAKAVNEWLVNRK